MDLVSGRRKPGFGWIESLAFLVFCAVVGTGVAVHEGWGDEAQAWLLARDLGWWQLLMHGVRYEGSPALWHSFLWLLSRLHFSFQGMHWAAGSIAVVGAFVLLRWSPFPLLLRVLLPFTFFLAYQNAVVARSYVLFPVLIFSVAALLSGERLRLVALAAAAGLLANVSLHGFVAATGLALAFLIAWRKDPRLLSLEKRKQTGMVALGIFAILWVTAIATAFPPSDIAMKPGVRIQKALHGKKFDKNLPAGPEQIDKKVSSSVEELTPVQMPEQTKTKWEAKQLTVIKQLSVITYPLSESHLLGLALFVLMILRAFGGKAKRGEAGTSRSQLWIGLLPYLLMVIFFSRMYLRPWHTGTLFASFLVAVWLTWPGQKPEGGFAIWRERLLVVALIVMCFEQIGWTARALKHDVQGQFSGDRAAADFLRQNAEGKKVAGFYFLSVGPVAYLGHPTYINQTEHEYWSWSNKVQINAQAPMTLRQHPDYVVVSQATDWDEQGLIHGWHYLSGSPVKETPADYMGDDYGIRDYYVSHGYRETHRYCGYAPMRTGRFATLCQAILEPSE